jgi:carbon storage regulator
MMEREMLVLTRKLNQEIVIGDEIRITIVAVGGDQVKLGITAPRSVPVHRLEVYQERQLDARPLEKVVPA